jgi:hypothetical protein
MNCRFHNKSPCPECSMDDYIPDSRSIQASKDREAVLSQPDLGKVIDKEIANRLGISVYKVERIRREAGIESLQASMRRLHPVDQRAPHTPSWLSPYLERWGRAT